jgi:hypothetical protein
MILARFAADPAVPGDSPRSLRAAAATARVFAQAGGGTVPHGRIISLLNDRWLRRFGPEAGRH